MPLNISEIRSFQPKKKSYKKTDGRGLYLLIKPNGSKLWYLKYYFRGKEKKLSLGPFPEVSLANARRLREVARLKVLEGTDPMSERKREKDEEKRGSEHTFESVALEYIQDNMVRAGRAETTLRKARWFLDLLKPAIGDMPIAEVDPQMMLAPLKKLEARGNLETAKKCKSFASRVFRYAAATGRCQSDPTAILQGALVSPKARHYAAILDPAKLGELLRAIDDFECSPITKAALHIAPHVFVRPGELRHGEWNEVDWDKKVWTIPAGKMKARRTHAVPLSRQVLEYLELYKAKMGGDGYIFPSLYASNRPMSENTVNVAFRRMGFSREEITGHGLRSTASTFLNESGKWHPDAIERALAHGDSNAVRSVYNRGNYWDERVRMAQWWSDYLDQLRDGGNVNPMNHRSGAC